MLSKFLRAAAGGIGGIEFVGAYGADLGSITSATITFESNLTGGLSTSPQQGDIVLILLGSSSGADRTFGTSSSGWTLEADLYANRSSSTADANLGLFYKVMGATPDTNITVTVNTGTFIQSLTYVLRGVNTSTPLDVASTTNTSTSNGTPDPPAITPVTTGSAVVGIGVGAGSGGLSPLTSSDLSNFVAFGSGFAQLGIGVIYDWQSGSVNPSSFGGDDDNMLSSAAVTMALRLA